VQAAFVRHALRLLKHAQRRIAAPDFSLRELGGNLQRVMTATRTDLEDPLVIPPRQHGEDLSTLRKDIPWIVACDVLAVDQLAVDEPLILVAIPATGGAVDPCRIGIGRTALARNRLDGCRPLHQRFEARLEFAAHLIERRRGDPTVVDATVFGQCGERRRRRRIGERRIDLTQALVEILGHGGLVESRCLDVGIDSRLEARCRNRQIRQKVQ